MNQKKNRAAGWVVRIALLGLLGVGLLFAFRSVESLRVGALQMSLASEMQAQQSASFEEVVRTLERNRTKIDRIRSQVISRDEITSVIGALEAEARGRGITLEFSDVVEKQATSSEGSVVEATGPVRDIIISFTANGPPHQLIAFFSAIEHLPFFAFVDTWEFKATELSVRVQTDPEAPEETPVPVGRLAADIVVVVEF